MQLGRLCVVILDSDFQVCLYSPICGNISMPYMKPIHAGLKIISLLLSGRTGFRGVFVVT